MLSACSAQDPVKETVPFWSTELEGEAQGQDKLLPHHLGPWAGPHGSGALHTHLAKSCLQQVYVV